MAKTDQIKPPVLLISDTVEIVKLVWIITKINYFLTLMNFSNKSSYKDQDDSNNPYYHKIKSKTFYLQNLNKRCRTILIIPNQGLMKIFNH